MWIYDANTSQWKAGTQTIGNGSAVTFPRLGTYLIDGNVNWASMASEIAQLDLAILGMYPNWNSGGAQTTMNAIRALNPDILLGNYTNCMEVWTSDSGYAPRRSKITSELGPGGVGDWYAYTSDGQHCSEYAGTYGINITSYVTADENGDIYPEWQAGWDSDNIFGETWDIAFVDNLFWQPRFTCDWNRDGNNDAATSSLARNATRSGQASYYDRMHSIRPELEIIANCDNDLGQQIYPGAEDAYTTFNGKLHGALLERVIGEDWSVETWGSWGQMMDWYHAMYNRLIDPKRVLFVVTLSPTDYQTMRYALASALMDDGYFCPAAAAYTDIQWYDEYDLDGAGTTKWLGAAVDPPQTSAWSNGVYRRRFENGLALVNPKGNGQKTVTVGSGWKKFSGSQASSVNNGATVSSVTLADRDGLLMQTV